MNYKIIETAHDMPDILLYRDRNEEGSEVVKILAIGAISGDDDMFAIETIEFETSASAQGFIRDYSKKSAEAWCKEQDIKYSIEETV